MEYNVFISHSSENIEQVKPLCAYLEDKGIKCFVSYRDIPSGVSYPGAITRAMRESEMLLLVLSKESNESTQVDRELTLANDQKKKMSCFRLEDIAYSDDKAYLMSGVNWLDAFPSPEQHYFELLQDICRQLGREVPKQEETEEDKRERYERILGSLISNASKGNSDAQYELGKAYYDGTYSLTIDAEEAFRWIMKAAKKGHIFAENHIGVCYATGIFVEKNDEEAIKWYRLSALHGNVVAQGNLGFKYYFGEGCKKDIAQAVKWWSLAADQGYDEAQKRLGDCYYLGEGVEIDYEKAVSLYEKAVAQDNDSAQIMLATCYREGKGVEKDLEKCLNLLDIAAKNSSTDAMTELASLYESGEDIEENPEKAFYYVKMAADKGDPFCMYHLSRFYHEGYGCEVDLNLWFEYLNKAANANQPNALDYLGDIYLFGNEELNIQIDEQKAIMWYQKAVDQDYTMAMVDLALCYSPGGCLSLDDVKAIELLKRAAEAGDDRGQYFLSDRYQQGDGIEQNDIEAFNWCLKSAEQEYVYAMSKLGKYYFYGFGTEQNFEKAVEWFAKATWEGDDEAKYLWGLCYELGYGVEKSYGNAAVRYYFSASQDNNIAKEAHDRLFNYLTKMAEEGDADSQYELGLYYMALDENMDNNSNLEYLKQSLEYTLKAADQNHIKALNNAAWTLHLLGRYEEALPWAEKAIESSPKDSNVVDTLATVYQGLGVYNEALEQFELCLKLKQEQNDNEESINETEEKIAELKELMKKGK